MKVKISTLMYGILFFLIVYGNVLYQYVGVFGLLDEVVAIISIAYILCHLRKIENDFLIIVICILFMTILAFAGNIMFHYQDYQIAIGKDMLAFYKMPVTFIAVYMWAKDKNFNEAHNIAVIISKISIPLIFALCIISIFTDIGLSYGIRYGFRTYKFLFSHPTYLVYSLVVMSSVLVANQEKSDKIANVIFQFMALFSMLFTFRDKGFGYIALYVVLMIFLSKKRKVKIRYFAIAGILAFAISYQKLVEYKTWTWSPRSALYANGFQLATDVFPIGSGFATFNSFLSGEYYSKAYYLFGLEKKPGLSPINYVDAGDAQIPYYYTQFGFLGFVLFLYVLYLISRKIKQTYKERNFVLKSAYLLMGYMVIGSLVEAVFTNESGVTCVLVLLLYLNWNNTNLSLQQAR